MLENHLYLNSTWIWNKLPPSLNLKNSFKTEEEVLLSKLGLNKNDPFVIIHLREAHYYNKHVLGSRNPEASSDYDCRNPNIETYLDAIKYLISENIVVIKTGFPGSVCNINLDGFIDYANNYRSEFGDIYLHAKAKFVISGAAGNFQLAHIFNTPSILTNSYDYGVKPQLKNDMILPALYKKNETDQFVNASEILKVGVEMSSKKYLDKYNLSLVHNSKDEILMAIKEMNENIDSLSLIKQNNKNRLAIEFDSLYEPNHIGYGLDSKVSDYWLDKYHKILK